MFFYYKINKINKQFNLRKSIKNKQILFNCFKTLNLVIKSIKYLNVCMILFRIIDNR